MKQEIIFVTGNTHKFQEVSSLIETSVPNFQVKQANLPLQELQADTLEEVAKFKILSVKDHLTPPYFIEDAGFFVDSVCHGFPGVYSSYVMKAIGYKGILKIMEGESIRNAHFESVIAYIDKNSQIHIFKGSNLGIVATEARGSSGFGFDPIFLSNDHPNKTFAELTTGEKNEISHRRRAMMKLIEFLKLEKK